jgi:regulator of protease activity HflC (stomatin/prohibitin superfamily)
MPGLSVPARMVPAIEVALILAAVMTQTTLRSVPGQTSLDDLRLPRDVINQKLQEIIDRQTETWGVKATMVEVNDMALPGQHEARDGQTSRG